MKYRKFLKEGSEEESSNKVIKYIETLKHTKKAEKKEEKNQKNLKFKEYCKENTWRRPLYLKDGNQNQECPAHSWLC